MTDNQHDPKAASEEPGGYGTPTAEQEMPGGDTGTFAQPRGDVAADNVPTAPGPDAAPEDSEATVPSSEAELDASNTEKTDAGRPFSSEPGPDAAGLPDDSGTDLPQSGAPADRDDTKQQFDAG